MSTMLQISHRMFVSAIAYPSDRDDNKRPRRAVRNRGRHLLEVLDSAEPLVEVAARQLRVAAVPARA